MLFSRKYNRHLIIRSQDDGSCWSRNYVGKHVVHFFSLWVQRRKNVDISN